MANWSRRQDLHPHYAESEARCLCVGLRREKWCSRQEFRLQPPRSKRGALYIELRGFEMAASNGFAPSTSRSKAAPRAPDSHRVIRFCRPMVRRLRLARDESGETNGIRTRCDGFHRAGCCSYIMVSI